MSAWWKGHVFRRRRLLRIAGCCCALACACLMLCGCYPSDFFKQIVIDYRAEDEFENSVTKQMVNSPDATEESDYLSALELSDKAKRSETEENIVVWTSGEATVDGLAAHHSVFDFVPRYPGIEASDGVRLEQAADDATKWVDHEVDSKEEEEPDEAKEQGAGEKDEETETKDKSKNSQKSDKGQSGNDSTDKASDEGGKSSEQSDSDAGGSDTDAESGDDGEGKGGGAEDADDSPEDGGEGESDDEGAEEVEGGGYGKNVEPVYNPNDARAKVQKADHIAAMGQAAVIVQAIGGQGALCAMDEATYNGEASYNIAAFKDVFADELPKDFAKKALQWESDGTSYKDVKDIKKLVQRVGANGVILYLGEYGTQSTYFTDEMMEVIEKASIQLVPVDLRTVQGILDAVHVTGEILSESAEVEWDTEEKAQQYWDAVSDIVKAVADTHGGSLEGSTAMSYDSRSTLMTSYVSCPVSCGTMTGTWTTALVADKLDSSIRFDSSNTGVDISLSSGLLFTRVGCKASPLSFWLQVADVINRASFDMSLESQVDYFPLIPIFSPDIASTKSFTWGKNSLFNDDYYQSATGYSDYVNASTSNPTIWFSNCPCNGMTGKIMGPGSKYTPYLVVCSDENNSAADTKKAIVKEMKDPDSLYYAYYSGIRPAYKTVDGGTWEESNAPSFMGISQDSSASNGHHNAFEENDIAAEDAVVENPTGLLGSWTEGSMESVLESIWAATVYSKKADGSEYEPVCDMDGFAVDIDADGADEENLEQAVKAFYSAFYRYEFGDNGASVNYAEVVTDEGPGE